jgi:uncharacterized protein YyaL (SSP411 family)
VPPGFDDKVLTDWNGLMMAALAEAGLVFDRPRWIADAGAAFDSVVALLWNGEVLHHSYCAGEVRNLATADGYANLIAAALALYEATGKGELLSKAETLARALIRDHWDESAGGFYFTSANVENLPVRQRYAHDDATPNANATMMANFVRLEVATGNAEYRRRGEAIHDAFAGAVRRNPFAHASFMSAFLDLAELVQAVIVGAEDGPATAQMRKAVLEQPLANRFLVTVGEAQALPAGHPAAGKRASHGQATLFVCRGQTCSLPITDPAKAGEALSGSFG